MAGCTRRRGRREALLGPWLAGEGRLMEVRKAVLPVAGLGLRFLPATKAQPKEMLPIVDKPLVQYAVEEAAESGIDLAILVTGRGKSAIENHFDVSVELEYELQSRHKTEWLDRISPIADLPQIAYVRQKRALGLGHAVQTARRLVGNEPFAVLLSDDVITANVPCLKQMLKVFEHYGSGSSVVAIQQVPRSEVSKYGIIKGDPVDNAVWGGRLYRITDMVEKPTPEEAPSDLAIIGRYVLTPEVFDEIAQTAPSANGEIQLTDALRRLLKRQPVYGFRFEGTRYDAGDKLGFVEATVGIALERPDLREELRVFLKSLVL
jgi:UTP--glucose-1-phosphate uridylyltransferase